VLKYPAAKFALPVGILLLGLVLRLWNINFGLPHSWYADEPEIGEPAIKYTYELKNILRNNDIYKLIPESYVYGTFPVYFYTALAMVFSKTLGILGIAFAKMDLYVYMRVINALISFAMIPVFYLVLRGLGLAKQPPVAIAGVFLMVFNWKLIVHAHYLNHDIVITLLLLLANLFYLRYLRCRQTSNIPEGDTVNTVLFALFFGLAVSTKITVLLTFPVYLLVFLSNKDFRNLCATIFTVVGVFIVTNPFAWVFMGDFVGRLLEMRTTEAGMVFDSVNYSPFKYLSALAWVLTLPVFLISAVGITRTVKEKTSYKKQFYIVMALQIVFYLVFFSAQSRRVDRWMLPIIPNLMLFSLIALELFLAAEKKRAFNLLGVLVIAGTGLYYLYFPLILLSQFQRNTPKSGAYIWAKKNLPPLSTKFGLTEEGLDPLNKLFVSTIRQYNAYESKGGQFMYPPDPLLYDYILIASRPMSWTRNPEVIKKYPHYASRWRDFNFTLNDSTKFSKLKSFELSEPNLIPLSNVSIYQRKAERLLLE